MSTSSATLDRIRANYAVTYKGHKLKRDTAQECEQYISVREYFLRREVELGRIDKAHLNVIEDFRFPTDTLVATYTNPRTATESRINMRDVKEAEAVLQPYLEKSEELQKKMSISLVAHCKGNNTDLAKEPLQRGKDKVLAKLTMTEQDAFDKLLPKMLANLPPYLQANPAIKNITTRSFLEVEFYRKRNIASLQAKIASREQELQGPISDPMVALRKRGEIQELKALLEKFQKLDTYALYSALVVYLVCEGDLDKARDQLYAQVKADIIANSGFSLSKINPLSKGPELTKEQNEYALDVVGLLFTDARGYAEFCRANGRPMKKESFEDIFIREAINFAMHADRTPGKEYQATNFENCIFLNGIGEGLKQEIKDEFLRLGAIATHAIGLPAPGEYVVNPPEEYPAGATDADKKAIDKRNAAKLKTDEATLKGHIAAHRSRVDWNRNDLPPVANTGILAAPVIGPVGALTAATAAVVAGTQLLPGAVNALAPYVPPIVEAGSRVVQAITDHIPQLVVDGFRAAQEMAPPMPQGVVETGRNALALVPWVSQGVVNGVRAIQNNPVTTIAAATVVDKGFTSIWQRERGPDGAPRRRFKPLRAVVMTAAGALALYNAPQGALQTLVSATGALKDWIFLPANVAVKFVAGLAVAEQLLKRVKKDIRERNLVNLTAITTLTTLAALMYYAANDGVVDNGILEMAGNWMGSVIAATAGAAYNVYNYNKVTQIASMVGVSGLLAWKEGKDQKEATQLVATSAMMGMPINQIILAGKGVVDRELPPTLATIISVPMDGASGFAGNMGMVKNGEVLGGIVVGISGLAGRLFGSIKEAYTTIRQTNPAPLVLI